MKHLKNYKLFEALNDPSSIEQFVKEINLRPEHQQSVISWWNTNRNGFKIHHFPFSSPQPIAGVFLGVDEVAINSRLPMPPFMKLFLALHESAHCDQHRLGIFSENYYDPVVDGRKEDFLEGYRRLERQANDFAIRSMGEMGFSDEMDKEEDKIRSNERAGEMVFRMMSNDIQRLNPVDFIDLLKKQIL
jgi:hypothetical protein